METLLKLNTKIVIVCSKEHGVIIARAEYVGGQPQYLIRYKNASGLAVEQWWSADSIECID